MPAACWHCRPARRRAGRASRCAAVDSTDAKNVHVIFQYDGDAKDVSGLKVTENGKAVDPGTVTTALEAKKPPAIVFVIDSSTSTDANAVLSEGRQALHALVAAVPEGTELAVVTAGGEAALLQPLTTDKAAIDKSIDAITPNGDGARLGGQWPGRPGSSRPIRRRSR